ncbi:zinc-binding dehydrogenase family protein [Paraburkholderia xenovorans LB400]|uniref:Alcohol dehydrogenase n=1 Tax=Paraburkholderia xenovorans (strain LB400) TaxID=266265 RepID=Q13FL3_PARXL|nr:NAD(P)-dependent alcohol dehydrogenase [Paraburkholderia xenovorans]ABE37126.1 putative alcohol dehydrogenase [Paraburkholderia xenovorans LB400]AIP34835.1 zinc-binding dehydrogenase family protein [Paraburkholderia xenovorans LB400]
MKVYRFDQAGSLDHLTLHDEPTPEPQRGEVLIRVRASSLNYRDIAMVHGTYLRAQRAGLIPLSDAAGEIVAVGEDVVDFKVGERVINTFHPRWYGGNPPPTLGSEGYGSHRDGWLSEYKVVSQEAIVAAPPGLSFEEAATLPCAALTAWTSLSGLRPLRPGQTVLTQGSGGVSVFAVQLAKLLGARVIATTSSAEKAARLKALGADEVINYVETPAWGERVRELTEGRGVDRVLEVGGPGTLEQSIKAVASRGEVALIGFLASGDSGVGFNDLFRSGGVFYRISVGDRSGLLELVRAVTSSGLKPVIDTVFPFERALDAWHHFDDRAFFGKVVISH